MDKNTGEASGDFKIQRTSVLKADVHGGPSGVQAGPSGAQDDHRDVYDRLWMKEWQRIPNAEFLVKYIFSEDGYTILISNLCDLYGENLTSNEVQERFSILNPHAEMKSNVIMKYVKESFEKFLVENNLPKYESSKYEYPLYENSSKFTHQCSSKITTIQLIFKVCQVSFAFEIKPQLLPSEKFRAHLMAPTVYASTSMNFDIYKCKKATSQTPNVKYTHSNKGDIMLIEKSQIPVDDLLSQFITLQSVITENNVSVNSLFENEIPIVEGNKAKACSEMYEVVTTSTKRPIEVEEETAGPSSTKDELVFTKKKKKFNF